MKAVTVVLAAAAAAVVAGCGGAESEPTESPPAESPRVPVPGITTPPGGAGALPPGHPAVPASLPFETPEGWQAEKPASAMRKAQFRLPRADGDGEDGEVVVFQGSMGGTRDNIDRWRGQFSGVVHGKDTLEERTEGMKGKVTLLDVTGTYSGGAMPGTGHEGGEASPETRMIGAILEIPGGPYYVKAVGPAGTMGKWEASIREYILAAARTP